MVTRPAVIRVMSTQPGTSPRSRSVARRCSPPRTTCATTVMLAVTLAVNDWMRFMRVPWLVVRNGDRLGSDRELQEGDAGEDREQHGDRQYQEDHRDHHRDLFLAALLHDRAPTDFTNVLCPV